MDVWGNMRPHLLSLTRTMVDKSFWRRSQKRVVIILRHFLKSDYKVYSDETHLKAAMKWLCRAQDVTGCGGVSAGYNVLDGWRPPFPETTGYIIPTFLKYASLSGHTAFKERAIMMGEWEIDIQLPSGGVRGGVGINEHPLVFDTGQVLSGWLSLYAETKMDRFLDAARKAGDWLVNIQDEDGKWSKHAYHAIPHTYYTGVAAVLLQLHALTANGRYRYGAEKNIAWVLTQVRNNGWFDRMGFTLEQSNTPYTHTIAYTLQGLIEAYKFLADEVRSNLLSVIERASENIISKYILVKPSNPPCDLKAAYLPGTLDSRWESKEKYTCLTGNVQLAIVFFKLHLITNKTIYRDAALMLIDGVKATQSLASKNPGIRGGIAGSWPIWGGYSSYNYLNWATKYFADALILKREVYSEIQ